MFGAKLNQISKAISSSLALLTDNDLFNIIVYNHEVGPWQSSPVKATAANIEAAAQFMTGLHSAWGSRMDVALEHALSHITDDSYSNSIVVLSDGRSPLDPRAIESRNTHKAGIFPVGIGDDIDYFRLEMLASLNYGFTTYFGDDDNLNQGVERLFHKISQPIMKDVQMEFGRADLHDILPSKVPAAYAGSAFFMAGRYANASESGLAIAGQSVAGTSAFDFKLNFNSQTAWHKFAEHIWAKQKIEELEGQIEIYGETNALREELIGISLKYNIRCRYTAYVADYETEHTGIDKKYETLVQLPESYLVNNYPNPFNPSTTINFYITSDDIGKTKLIKIYNVLGRLVAVIDVSHFEAGAHSILFDGRDQFGAQLPSGHYFVRLQVGEQVSTLKITLEK
jgi:Ca-activated chloride channel family protein